MSERNETTQKIINALDAVGYDVLDISPVYSRGGLVAEPRRPAKAKDTASSTLKLRICPQYQKQD